MYFTETIKVFPYANVRAPTAMQARFPCKRASGDIESLVGHLMVPRELTLKPPSPIGKLQITDKQITSVRRLGHGTATAARE
jgi:hypothetical protein